MNAIILALILSNPFVLDADSPPRYERSSSGIVYRVTPLSAGAAAVGPTAPTAAVCGSGAGLLMNGTDEVYLSRSVPTCWDGVNPILLYVVFGPESGDAFANGETVTPTFTWRSGTVGESFSAGTAEVDSGVYTQSGAGLDCAFAIHVLTLAVSGANQSYTYGDLITGVMTFADTYSGTPLYGGTYLYVPIKQLCLTQ